MNDYAHAMVAFVAKHEARATEDEGRGDWLEAERFYDMQFEAEARSTPEALARVEMWLEGKLDVLPQKGRAA